MCDPNITVGELIIFGELSLAFYIAFVCLTLLVRKRFCKYNDAEFLQWGYLLCASKVLNK